MTILIRLNVFALGLSILRLPTLTIYIGHTCPIKLDQSITTESKFDLFFIDDKQSVAWVL